MFFLNTGTGLSWLNKLKAYTYDLYYYTLGMNLGTYTVNKNCVVPVIFNFESSVTFWNTNFGPNLKIW